MSFSKGAAGANGRHANDASASGIGGRDHASRDIGEEQSPYAAVLLPRRRGRRARTRAASGTPRAAAIAVSRDNLVVGSQRTPRAAAIASIGSGATVVSLPRLDPSVRRSGPSPEARGAPTARCVMPGLQRRMHDTLDAPALPSCATVHRSWIF
jgi:hypothetical protein